MAIADKAYSTGQYEASFERDLKAYDGSDTGVKLWIKGLDCQASLDVSNKYKIDVTDLMLQTHAAKKDDESDHVLPKGERGRLFVEEMRDRYIACISRWDFGGQELFDGEGEPECDYETKARFMAIPAFHEQVVKWVEEISDFTKPSKKG